MLESFVIWTLLAALMQAVRTAAQKTLNQTVSVGSATLVRYLFGLPFVAIYGAVVVNPSIVDHVTIGFVVRVIAAGLLQIIATMLLVYLFSLRSFAVGSTTIRLEIVITAILGILFFAASLAWIALAGMVISTLGLLRVYAKPVSVSGWMGKDALIGLVAATAFSLTSLLVRDASIGLQLASPISAAGFTLLCMVVLQTVVCLGIVAWQRPAELKQVARQWRLSSFIGLTSVLGSIGWFTAFTLEGAAVVKTLGQVELIFALLIAYFFFAERPSVKEWQGIGLMLLGIVMVLSAGF
ncbi:MAG: DMT family transporter [Pseudomonadales bacterium]